MARLVGTQLSIAITKDINGRPEKKNIAENIYSCSLENKILVARCIMCNTLILVCYNLRILEKWNVYIRSYSTINN